MSTGDTRTHTTQRVVVTYSLPNPLLRVIIIQTDVNGVYHRPSRPISQQHVGIPPRDPERAEMQASIFNSGGRCGGERGGTSVCEREVDTLMIQNRFEVSVRWMGSGTALCSQAAMVK